MRQRICCSNKEQVLHKQFAFATTLRLQIQISQPPSTNSPCNSSLLCSFVIFSYLVAYLLTTCSVLHFGIIFAIMIIHAPAFCYDNEDCPVWQRICFLRSFCLDSFATRSSSTPVHNNSYAQPLKHCPHRVVSVWKGSSRGWITFNWHKVLLLSCSSPPPLVDEFLPPNDNLFSLECNYYNRLLTFTRIRRTRIRSLSPQKRSSNQSHEDIPRNSVM